MSDDRFECGNDLIETTMNGMFGGEMNSCSRYIRGIPWYRVNGALVSEREFRELLKAAYPDIYATSQSLAEATDWPPRWVTEAWKSAGAADAVDPVDGDRTPRPRA